MKKLTCHCGEVEIQINLRDNIDKLMRCNCSMCKRKGTMVTTINKEDLKIVKGKDKIKTYQFNTGVAKHHFCSECGIHTHNLRRSNPNTFGINVGCIDEIENNKLFRLKTVINDGQNHIKDRR
ncbi:GFA family protein [Candidatus Pelagibacter sp. Uisw_114]|tara:strand:+ start:82 stop:450 length:369 start_codon:yes stop_codon:yes gene_type:complete